MNLNLKHYGHELNDTIWLMLLQGLNYLAPLLVWPYLMATLGAEQFGHIGFALGVCQFLLLIVDYGFNLSATQRIAVAIGNKEEMNRIFSGTFYAKMGLLLISSCLLLLLMLVPRFAIYREAMLLMFFTVVGNALFFTFLFQGVGRIRWAAIINCIAKLSLLPLTFVFVNGPADCDIAILLQSGVNVFAAIVSIVVVGCQKWVRLLPFDFRQVKTELAEGWPIFLSQTSTSIYMTLFVIALGYWCVPDDVGRYSAADKLIRAAIWVLVAPVIQSFYPKICQLAHDNRDEALVVAKRIVKLITIPMLCETLVFLFGGNIIIQLLGDDYAETNLLFRIMSVIPLFSGISLTASQLILLAVYNKKKEYKRVCIMAGIIALLGIMTVIPFFQVNGAAILLVAIEAFICVMMLYYSKSKNG